MHACTQLGAGIPKMYLYTGLQQETVGKQCIPGKESIAIAHDDYSLSLAHADLHGTVRNGWVEIKGACICSKTKLQYVFLVPMAGPCVGKQSSNKAAEIRNCEVSRAGL